MSTSEIMSALAQKQSYLFNSRQNLLQKSSNLGFCELNDLQREESVQDTENVKRSNQAYDKSQLTTLSAPHPRGIFRTAFKNEKVNA